MILAVSISAGFRREIHQGIRSICGDIQLMPVDMNVLNEDEPVSAHPSYWEKIDSLPAVRAITPVIWRSGIVKDGPGISGVLFKGIPSQDTVALQCSIPRQLSRASGLNWEGDDLTTYFIGERVRVRKFHVTEVQRDMLEMDDNLVVYANLSDIQRLNGWSADQAFRPGSVRGSGPPHQPVDQRPHRRDRDAPRPERRGRGGQPRGHLLRAHLRADFRLAGPAGFQCAGHPDPDDRRGGREHDFGPADRPVPEHRHHRHAQDPGHGRPRHRQGLPARGGGCRPERNAHRECPGPAVLLRPAGDRIC